MQMAEQLRDRLPWLRLEVNAGGGSFKSQFKRADKSGARFAILLGEDELASGLIGIKALREEIDQQRLDFEGLVQLLTIQTARPAAHSHEATHGI
jgi:histidyl-tRNA synthetase